MKKTRLVLLTSVITLMAFAAIVYSSCKKDPCSGVNCQNGGACSNGSCVCPSGYSGSFCELSSITFSNDTYTPISITVNNSPATIDVGSSVTFSGTAGSTAAVYASTSGSTTGGTQVGQLIVWSYTDKFPVNGSTLTEPFDVSSDYFFLKMINVNSSQSIITVKVNYQTTAEVDDNVTIPNDGNTYDIGYYSAYSNTEVYATSSSSGFWTWFPSIPNTANAEVTLTAH